MLLAGSYYIDLCYLIRSNFIENFSTEFSICTNFGKSNYQWRMNIRIINEEECNAWKISEYKSNIYRRNFGYGTKCTAQQNEYDQRKRNTHTQTETCQINISIPFRFTERIEFFHVDLAFNSIAKYSRNIECRPICIQLSSLSFSQSEFKMCRISDKVGRINSLQMSFVSVFSMLSQTSQILPSLPFVSEQLKINFRKFFDTLNVRKTQIIR